jgi:DNA (cytosine-5)-methyltransferase 1
VPAGGVSLPAVGACGVLVVDEDGIGGGRVSHYGVKLHRSDVLRLPHPEGPAEEDFAEWCRSRIESGARLAADVFSGAGGLSLGIEQAGWTVALSVDDDIRAQETHQANFAGLALRTDLGDPGKRSRIIALLRQASIDLIAGGPPCQPFSRAGRSKIKSLVDAGIRDAFDHRKELWRAYLEIVLAVRPRAVLMENVPDMALGDDFQVIRTIVDALESTGYHTAVRLVDAWVHGVPQHRKRLILLARLDSDTFTWPDPIARVNLREAIGDLPVLPEDDPVGARRLPYVLPDEPPEFVTLMRKAVTETDRIWDHMTRPVRPDDLETFKLMDHRTLYSAISPSLRRYKADTFDDKYKRLDWNNLSRSITAHIAKDGYWYIHPEQHRTLTVREAARIQTFPDHFRFSGTRSDAFRQIGNAVPPRLGEAAARALHPLPEREQGQPVALNTWIGLHSHLTAWAKQQRQGDLWYAFPGPGVRQAIAVLAALLGLDRLEADGLAETLGFLRGREKLLAAELNKFCDIARDERITQRLEVIRPLTPLQNVWRDLGELTQELHLKPAEKGLLHLLMGEDVMPASLPALRIAARVAGNESKRNQLTDGRVDLARLVGGGEDAPLRMAAIRLIGKTTCRPNEPVCSMCPLERWCASAHQLPTSGTIF